MRNQYAINSGLNTKQQLGKLLLAIRRAHLSSLHLPCGSSRPTPEVYTHAMNKKKDVAVCKSDFLFSPLLQHLLYWNGRHGHVLTERNETLFWQFWQPELILIGMLPTVAVFV